MSAAKGALPYFSLLQMEQMHQKMVKMEKELNAVKQRLNEVEKKEASQQKKDKNAFGSKKKDIC